MRSTIKKHINIIAFNRLCVLTSSGNEDTVNCDARLRVRFCIALNIDHVPVRLRLNEISEVLLRRHDQMEELISGMGVIQRCCIELRLEKKIAQGSCYILYRLLHIARTFRYVQHHLRVLIDSHMVSVMKPMCFTPLHSS